LGKTRCTTTDYEIMLLEKQQWMPVIA